MTHVDTDTKRTIAALTRELAHLGGTMARARQSEIIIGYKNGDARDVVTNIDIEISSLLVARIAAQFKDHGIYSEESGVEGAASNWLWSIDPIDGTSNYVRGLPHYSCVVTVLYQGAVQAAAVYAPVYGECYHLEAEIAYCDNRPLRTTHITKLHTAYVNFHPGRKEVDREWASDTLRGLLGGARKSMNLGSSALDLCYVAAGKTDAMIYGTLSTLDVAGAVAIVRAAGGEVYIYGTTTPVEFTAEPQKLVATTNDTLLTDLYEQLQQGEF